MARNKSLLLALILILDLMMKSSAINLDAYSNDMNTCLFNTWKAGGTSAPLSKVPDTCNDKKTQQPLCYSNAGSGQAQFVSCYNNATLIPDFTAHKVLKTRGGGRPDNAWHNDKGSFAPSPASSVLSPDDYDKTKQSGLYPNYNTNKQNLNKGHYVPNGDLPITSGNKEDRKITFVNTNAAPQWQPFNCGNWAAMENAIMNYVDSISGKEVYVFTGTAGQATGTGGKSIALNNVFVPKYFWKAVCVPGLGSYVFWAENNVGVIEETKKQAGCNGAQTPIKGIIQCKAYDAALKDGTAKTFMLPPFDTTNCKTSTIGTFLDSFLKLS